MRLCHSGNDKRCLSASTCIKKDIGLLDRWRNDRCLKVISELTRNLGRTSDADVKAGRKMGALLICVENCVCIWPLRSIYQREARRVGIVKISTYVVVPPNRIPRAYCRQLRQPCVKWTKPALFELGCLMEIPPAFRICCSRIRRASDHCVPNIPMRSDLKMDWETFPTNILEDLSWATVRKVA